MSQGSVQKGPSGKAAATWTGGAYGGVREHGQEARTPLADFFNTPPTVRIEGGLRLYKQKGVPDKEPDMHHTQTYFTKWRFPWKISHSRLKA
ncbi:MAG: hypothetical protein NPIRA06_12980 [Nitrospirales bacterium]|nr:MAG: hypothetical protein NPIRA06_12980 [Nitrospirales bacterium]